MSYTQCLYHIVFRTKRSERTINEENERMLYKFLYTFSLLKQCKVFRIGGMPDHIHLLVGLHPTISLAVFVKQIKEVSSRWLRGNPRFPTFDGWAEGYAGISCSYERRDAIIRYIMNQKEHHRRKSFSEEYKEWLTAEGFDTDGDFFLHDREA